MTEKIKENNVITAELADGWYRGSCGAWGLRNQYGTQTKILAQLEIKYKNGTKQTIVTDKNWQWSNDGAISFADIQDGEILDASKILHTLIRLKLRDIMLFLFAQTTSPLRNVRHSKAK